jgi:hypothetical protein
MATWPKAIRCIEKERLMTEYVNAVTDQNRIQSAQVESVKRGGSFPFEEELAMASERRLNAKYAIIAHQEQHGC